MGRVLGDVTGRPEADQAHAIGRRQQLDRLVEPVVEEAAGQRRDDVDTLVDQLANRALLAPAAGEGVLQAALQRQLCRQCLPERGEAVVPEPAHRADDRGVAGPHLRGDSGGRQVTDTVGMLGEVPRDDRLRWSQLSGSRRHLLDKCHVVNATAIF